jgi:type IV pilus assembly protein PilX
MNVHSVSLARRGRSMRGGSHAQRGIALVVALILLVLITLVGLAAMRGTIMQQRMAANLYDREQAFQSAEAAVRAATAQIPTDASIIWHNCQAGGIVCQPNPFDASGANPAPASAIHSVATGTGTGQYTASATAYGQPQFVVESMGNWVDQNTNTGFGQTANSRQYGAQGASGTAVYYRITARSGDPAVVGDRAVVTVQAVVKQG